MNIDKNEIISISKIHPSKVWNIYLYGSRVYGTSDVNSDYDIMITGGSTLETQEIYAATPSRQYNIHIHVPNKFEDDLRKHDIHTLECIWAPDFAKIQIKKDYNTEFNIDKVVLKKKLFTQSHDSWVKGCRKIKETDIYRGAKSIYHSLRILMFGIQISKNGRIINFEDGNSLYSEIMAADEYTWDYYKGKYLPLKKELEKRFRDS